MSEQSRETKLNHGEGEVVVHGEKDVGLLRCFSGREIKKVDDFTRLRSTIAVVAGEIEPEESSGRRSVVLKARELAADRYAPALPLHVFSSTELRRLVAVTTTHLTSTLTRRTRGNNVVLSVHQYTAWFDGAREIDDNRDHKLDLGRAHELDLVQCYLQLVFEGGVVMPDTVLAESIAPSSKLCSSSKL
ncbi:hypothetical protein F2Q70_00018068 [Brassica cretica]|uniref:Uncharacterized protein n=1 Tax=Brassica cretica TaxID=69181 RepID=A0A8S9I2I1_BRACR|nr:hypothetical protein F2Q70_00018068 [Brassica cretica]KAF2598219.1 hypothetical protein F2Q68_00011055 [Brassica cretica]